MNVPPSLILLLLEVLAIGSSLSYVLPFIFSSPCEKFLRKKDISCSEVALLGCYFDFHCKLNIYELGLDVLLDPKPCQGIKKCYMDLLSTRAREIFLKCKSKLVDFQFNCHHLWDDIGLTPIHKVFHDLWQLTAFSSLQIYILFLEVLTHLSFELTPDHFTKGSTCVINFKTFSFPDSLNWIRSLPPGSHSPNASLHHCTCSHHVLFPLSAYWSDFFHLRTPWEQGPYLIHLGSGVCYST